MPGPRGQYLVPRVKSDSEAEVDSLKITPNFSSARMERLLDYSDNRSKALLVAENAADGERRTQEKERKKLQVIFSFVKYSN